MLTLPFDALPDTPQLFRDYAANAESASTYFMGHFGGLAAYETHLHMLEQRQYPRQQLYELLVAQNKVFRSGEAGFANLELLRKDNTMAVVTGQQVGLGTGPLYTLYKALTACSLAQWLDEQFPAYRFVPIFWMECEDHDFLEINHFSVMSAQGGIADIHYAQPERARRAISRPWVRSHSTSASPKASPHCARPCRARNSPTRPCASPSMPTPPATRRKWPSPG